MGGVEIFSLFIEPGAEAHQFAVGGGDGFAGDVVAEHGDAAADAALELVRHDDLLIGALLEEFEWTAEWEAE